MAAITVKGFDGCIDFYPNPLGKGAFWKIPSQERRFYSVEGTVRLLGYPGRNASPITLELLTTGSIIGAIGVMQGNAPQQNDSHCLFFISQLLDRSSKSLSKQEWQDSIDHRCNSIILSCVRLEKLFLRSGIT
jgi:hypothetical protein